MLLPTHALGVVTMGTLHVTAPEHQKIERDTNITNSVVSFTRTMALQQFTNTWMKIESYNPALRLRGTILALQRRDDVTPDAGTTFASAVSTFFVTAIIILVAAVIYKKTMAMPARDMEKYSETNDFKGQDFKHGVFSCFEEPKLCLCTFCCWGIPWADTMDVVGLIGFWVGLTICIGTIFLDTLTGGISWFFMAAVFTYFRQQIRKQFEMKNETTDLAIDYALWLCCPCCSVVQQARQALEVPEKIIESSGEKNPEAA